MRNRNYRVWDKDLELLLYFNPFHPVCDGDYGGLDYWTTNTVYDIEAPLDIERYILMDYVGLKDKNGKEIYERDILRIIATSAKSPRMKWERREYIGEVRYNAPAFNVYLGDKILLVDGLYRKKLEVIGNIYENKDLLNDEPTR